MMNTQHQTSHTEMDLEDPSTNAMEQAALLRARCALARWRCSDQLVGSAGEAQCDGARAEWYAALEHRLHEWIAGGGLAQEPAVPAGDRPLLVSMRAAV